MKITELNVRMQKLNSEIKQALQSEGFGFFDYEAALDRIDDAQTSEERFLYKELLPLAEKLAEISGAIAYLDKPVTATGKLKKNKDGNFEACGHVLRKGNVIEYFQPHYELPYEGQSCESGSWTVGILTKPEKEYEIAMDPFVNLEGLTVRFRS